MKSFKNVEKNRINYHTNKNHSTVHRSSLLAPKIENAATWISFLNHFLIKRNYKRVVCKITSVAKNGSFIDSVSLEIEKPMVYSICLDELFELKLQISEYIIEFFSENNLYIPFPAVNVNHVGKGFVNTCHSYNRVLNDCFEDDLINSNHVSESSIDVLVNKDYDTFFNFVSGPISAPGKIEVSLKTNDKNFTKEISINQSKLTNKNYFISEIFEESDISTGAVLKISQPKQKMFYGRLLSGIIEKQTKYFSANHSYYDSSDTKEYFDNSLSQRIYPFFQNYYNGITFYPVMSPSDIHIHIEYLLHGEIIKSKSWVISSPSGNPLNIDINKIIGKNKQFVSAFSVVATVDGSKIPTRVNHQIQYSTSSSSCLKCSINTSLLNSEVFVPQGRPSFVWGQILLDLNYTSNLGLFFVSSLDGNEENISVEIYSESGIVWSFDSKLSPGESLILNQDDFNLKLDEGIFFWYVAKSKRSDLSAQFFHTNIKTGHSSGEHNF